ncbi:MAG: RagB/SusD family nutrient uptake outer membrane protein, partial [Sphingobacteriaceae bacterium]
MFNIKKIASVILLGTLLSTSSCKKYLDDNVSKSTITDVTQWASEGNADIFVNGIYGQLSNKSNTPDPLDDFTDDNDGGFYWRSYRWKAGTVGPSTDSGLPMGETNQTTNAGDYANWMLAYGKIRRCNLFLQKIEEYKTNFSATWMAKRTDEVRFLRAYYYSELWMHLGGLVLQTTVADNAVQSTDELKKPRSTFEETFNFIDNELDAIVKNGVLAVKYNLSNADAGRATLGAALCLKGWIELYAASPAFNSGTGPSGADPNNLVHFATADPTRWVKAAETNSKFISTYGTTYSLYPNLDQLWYAA